MSNIFGVLAKKIPEPTLPPCTLPLCYLLSAARPKALCPLAGSVDLGREEFAKPGRRRSHVSYTVGRPAATSAGSGLGI